MKPAYYETQYRQELYHWWYRVRRELVHDILSVNFSKRTDLHTADIGCGTGALTKELERYGECTGIDFSEQAVDFCIARGVRNVRVGSAEKTGLESDSLDALVCLDVLEHLPDDTKGIEEIRRILKPEGIAIIFVPCFMFLWGPTDKVSHHYRRYRLSELAKKISPENFTILRQSYFNTLLFPLIALVRMTVRLLHIKIESDIVMGSGTTNILLYRIFTFERWLLRYTNFPFGVSGMFVLKKDK
jgi:SAM-dependent methyltransferase